MHNSYLNPTLTAWSQKQFPFRAQNHRKMFSLVFLMCNRLIAIRVTGWLFYTEIKIHEIDKPVNFVDKANKLL